MLGAIKHYLNQAIVPTLYIAGFGTMLLTIFKEAKWGLFLFVVLIPQPNVWYKFYDYPVGKDFMDFLFLAILIGMFIQKKGISKTGNSILIFLFIIVGYLALWNSSMRFSLPLPISLSNYLVYEYKNYAQMIFLYFLVLSIIKEKDDQKTLIVIMCFVLLFIALRNYRNFLSGSVFSYDRRAVGPFWAVGLGPNHMGAFFAHYGVVFLALFLFDQNKKRKILFLSTILFSIHPLFFSFSRGAYAATFTVLVFYGLFKKRGLLILAVVIIVFWKTLLPSSVVDRISMTITEDGQIEKSADIRSRLWKLAYNEFKEHPLFGIGYTGYSLSVGGKTIETGKELKRGQDVHSIYMRILCEQGVIGFLLFMWILFASFRSGLKLYRISEEPFYKGLGFGFMGCVVASIITNMFGDRFSYFVLGSYFWILWGLVDSVNYQVNSPPLGSS